MKDADGRVIGRARAGFERTVGELRVEWSVEADFGRGQDSGVVGRRAGEFGSASLLLAGEDAAEHRTDAPAGLGFRFALGESGRSAIRLDLEDYFYDGDFGGGDEFQNDIVASLGLSIALGGRADSNEP